MKKSELVEIIRVAVRKELQATLPSILKESIKKYTLPPTKSKPKPKDIVQVAREKINSSRATTDDKHYSNNPAINKILNETVGGVPQGGSRVGGEADHTTITDFNGEGVNLEELPAHVSTALTRNYSDVIKLVDKKKGGV
jgi:hypothetical protein